MSEPILVTREALCLQFVKMLGELDDNERYSETHPTIAAHALERAAYHAGQMITLLKRIAPTTGAAE